MTEISRAELTMSRSLRALAIAQNRVWPGVVAEAPRAVRAGPGRLALSSRAVRTGRFPNRVGRAAASAFPEPDAGSPVAPLLARVTTSGAGPPWVDQKHRRPEPHGVGGNYQA